jgi:hypothetical protein
MNDNKVNESQVLGLDIERLKTVASLTEFDRNERERRIISASAGLDSRRDFLRQCEYIASLNGLTPEDRDREIEKAVKILEIVGELPGRPISV